MTDTVAVSLRSMLLTLSCLPSGAHSSDPLLTAWSSTQINNQAARCKLFKAKLRTREVRWFLTAELRDAFVASHTPAPRPFGLRWGTPAGARRALWAADAEAIVPPGLVIQKCPSHAPRFSEHRFAFVHG